MLAPSWSRRPPLCHNDPREPVEIPTDPHRLEPSRVLDLPCNPLHLIESDLERKESPDDQMLRCPYDQWVYHIESFIPGEQGLGRLPVEDFRL